MKIFPIPNLWAYYFSTKNFLDPILGNYKDNDDAETNNWVLTPKQINLFLCLFSLFTDSLVVK